MLRVRVSKIFLITFGVLGIKGKGRVKVCAFFRVFAASRELFFVSTLVFFLFGKVVCVYKVFKERD